MKTVRHKVSVIMPAYNEGEHILRNIEETRGVLVESGLKSEIIVVDDGSTDDTREQALAAAARYDDVFVVHFDGNVGKGNAIKEGFGRVTGDYVVFLDADLDLPPGQIPGLIAQMEGYGAQVIIGSKYHPESKIQYPFVRKVISRLYALFLRIFFGLPLRDTQTGLKVFEREVLKRVFPKILCKRYAYDLEILVNAHRLGYRIIEAPVVLSFKRVKNWGRIRLRDLYRTGLDTLAIFYRLNILKYYDTIKT